MFNLSNLNDYEFEILCKDIMSKKLSIDLYTFARGVDKGIDICDKEISPKLVIQAKHYIKSTYSQLMSSLKKEVTKVGQLNPERYYICTSQSLTHSNKVCILDLFSKYMGDISCIVDINDINDFLEKSENKDIVASNYKLWLCASNVLSLINNQDMFIDCEELIVDIEKQVCLFVKTDAYREALKKIQENKIIIILGEPGVGKSTVSKMIILHYVTEKYIVRYVSSNNIAELKKCVSIDQNKKEIVFIDDFLGQHYMNLKDTQPSELKILMAFIKKSKHKKLLLNSRITILNEAREKFIPFREIMENNDINKYLIDLDKMSEYEKAQILYNHLYFNELPQKHFQCIKENKNYLKIVKHKNYNPRIIEYITRQYNYSKIEDKDYMTYIMHKLSNPEDVWKDEFQNRLDVKDRALMNTLYSLTNTTVDGIVLEEAFTMRLISENIKDTSINQYEVVITRLTNSLLKNIDDKGKIKISVINPSINDYLRAEIKGNTAEQKKIIDSAVFFEQILKVIFSEVSKEYFINKLINDDLFNLKVLTNSSFFYFMKSIIDFDISKEELSCNLVLALEKAYIDLDNQNRKEYGKLVINLYKSYFYKLHASFLSSDKMRFILLPMFIKDIIFLTNAIVADYNLENNKELIEVLRNQLIEKINYQLYEEVFQDVYDIIDNSPNESGAEVNYEEVVRDKEETVICEKIENYMEQIAEVIDFKSEWINISEILDYADISEIIESAAADQDSEGDEDIREVATVSDDLQIISMFEH